MEAFSHQHQQFLDCDFLSNDTNIKMSGFEEICFDYYPSCVIVPQISWDKIPENMDFENSRKMSVHEGQMGLIDGCELVRQCSNGGRIRGKQEVDSSLVEHGDDHVIQQSLVENKRKNCDGYMLNSSQFKETKECKGKKPNSCSSLKKTEVKKLKTEKKKQRKICENPPSGYIQVRARRGEATDSHSLAERVRREKISQRMKLLQGLVPGCEKVTGKALMLDEIINYVQSLQNQVEILSMKLASVNPLLYDFGLVWEDYMKLRSSNPPTLTLQQSEYEQVAAFVNPTAFPTTSSYSLLDSSSFLPSDQTSISFSQDNHNLCWNVEDQKQSFMDQDCFKKMDLFQ